MAARRGMTLTELLVATGCIGCLVMAFVPAITSTKDAADRALCAANLGHIGRAMALYATDNDGLLPDCGASSPLHGAVPADGVHFPSRISAAGTCAWPDVRNAGNQANLWLLVRQGYALPHVFICPATSDRPSLNSDRNANVMGFLAMDPATGKATPQEQAFLSRVAAGRCSYSYQVQFAHPQTRPFPPPAPAVPPPVVLDDSGEAIEPPPPNAPLTMASSAYPPTTHHLRHPQDLAILADRNPYTRTDLVRQSVVSADDQPEANSLNHGGQGQNVLYLAGEVLWEDTPCCGPLRPDGTRDNIYWPDGGRPDDPVEIPRWYGDSFLAP